uniref:FAS1 domain-containing protein n=1 Tax=Salix viminalis TaxID=40686 RepID=A0A6N2M4I2_SALVM
MRQRSVSLVLFSLILFFLRYCTRTSGQSPAAAPAMPPPTTNAPSQAPSAQVATSPGPVDVGKILQKAGHFTVFVRLMQATTEDAELNKEMNTTNNGITIFAPSDNAFSSLKSGFLNALSDEDKTELVKFHVLPALISSSQFQTVSNPVRTQAGTGPRVTLNVTTTGNFVNISTGLTNTSAISAHKLPAPAPAPELGKPGKAAAGAERPTAPKDISGALTPLILVHNNALPLAVLSCMHRPLRCPKMQRFILLLSLLFLHNCSRTFCQSSVQSPAPTKAPVPPPSLAVPTDTIKILLKAGRFLSFVRLMKATQTVSNPVKTLAGSDNKLPLTITTSDNSVKISSGLTKTSISNTVYTDKQVAIYEVDKVLVPKDLFPPAPPAPAPAKPVEESPVAPRDASVGAIVVLHRHLVFFGVGVYIAALVFTL